MRGGSGPVGSLAAHDLRRRWRTVVVVAVLFGLAAGGGLACIAGARRTSTLFSRHLTASRGSDVEIDPGRITPESDAALRSIPEVEEASWWATIGAYPLDLEGRVRADVFSLLTITSDGRYLDMDRVATVAGRRLDPRRPDEIMVNELAAEVLDLHVGSTVPLGLFELDPDSYPLRRRPDRSERVTVVGIMALNEDVTADVVDQFPRLFVSPAFQPATDAATSSYFGFSWYGLRLRHGQADVESVIRQWDALAAEHNAGLDPSDPGWLTFVHRSSDLQLKADRAVRPLVVALAAFGALATLAALVLAGQTLARAVRLGADDLGVARVLGLRPAESVTVALAVPVVAVGLAAMTALVTAVLVSTAFPAGPHEVLEPHPGVSVDAVVLLPGLALLVVVPLLAGLIAARREARAGVLQRADGHLRRSRLVAAVARSGASSPTVASLRLTMEPGQGRSFVPTRSILVSNTIVVVALMASIVFGGNLAALVREPERFGWVGDGLLDTDGGYGRFDPEVAGDWLDSRAEVDGWRLVGADRTTVDGRDTPGVAYGDSAGTGESLLPVLTSGRAPRAGEVVLGDKTMAAIDAHVGSTVSLGAGAVRRDASVVGTAVFPVLGPVLAVRTGLDEGVWVAEGDIEVFDLLGAYGAPWNFVFLDLSSEDDVAALNAVVDDAPVTEPGADSDVYGVIQPAEVRTATSAGGYEAALVTVLGVVALTSILLTLLAVIRRRRLDLAVYRVLGFTPRQLRSTIALQGIWFALAAVVIGGPVGVAAGTELWRLFAEKLGVVPDPTVAWGAVLAAGAGMLVVGVLSAVVPALAAGRGRYFVPDPA